ncbi:MAG: tetratricopeptide repeat protein, partial [Planctomycetaceae bacterium]
EQDQARPALQLLEKLGKSQPENPWVATTQALIFLEEGRIADSKETLQPAYQAHPQNDLILALYALSSLANDGYDSARPLVHRAFQRCSSSFPDLVSGIAGHVAEYMFALGRYLSARQHLALSMRFSSEKNRQDIFVKLLQFDGDHNIPYPLRSVHHLAEYVGDGELKKEAAKGMALSGVGCWGPAAKIFSRMAEQDTEDAALWHNVGLCRAWDGDESGAAEALHRAATLYREFEAAVECETLAQFLDIAYTGDRVRSVPAEYRVKSVSRLLTLLDAQERVQRQEISPEEFAQPLGLDVLPAGLFNIVDRAPLDGPVSKETPLDSVPVALAQLVIFDADPEDELDARAVLSLFDTEPSRAAQTLFEQIAGDDMERVPEGEEEYAQRGHAIPREFLPLEVRWHVDRKTPLGARRALERQNWEHFVNQVWPSTYLPSLGMTPLEAAKNAALKVQLMSAVYVLDAISASREHALDLPALCRLLDLEPPKPLEVAETTPLNTFSPMQLQRLNLKALTDTQINTVLNRALLIHHPAFLYEVLVQALGRPACLERINLVRVYSTLAELSRDRGRIDDALAWIAKGKEAAEAGDKEKLFEAKLEWTLREFNLRLEDPEDPGLNSVVRHLWNYYVPKLPKLASHIAEAMNRFGLPAPEGEPEGAIGSTTDGGIWTPSPAGASAEGGRKLWIPGQE